MKMEVDLSALMQLEQKLERLQSGAMERLEQAAKQSAARITGTAKGLVYQDGLKHVDGAIQDSLRPYSSVEDGVVQTGVETSLDIAVYHEMGTGPVGTAAGYPGEEYLDQPVARRSTGWTYYSEDMATQRSGIDPGEDRSFDSFDDYYTWKHSGFVYTEGVPPKAFMHNAVMQRREIEMKALQKALMEVEE